MAKIYRISRTALKVLHKVHHRKGHGIHSPFVFSLITKVIEEHAPYYGYADITQYLQEHPKTTGKTEKYNRLLFRLVNYFNAKSVLEIGSGRGITTLYLTRVAKDIICNSIELDEKKNMQAKVLYVDWDRDIILHTEVLPAIKQPQDCILVNLNNYHAGYALFSDYVFPLCHSTTFVVIKGIRSKKANQALWKSLCASEQVSVSIDLFSIGILFFNPKLHKRKYRLNF